MSEEVKNYLDYNVLLRIRVYQVFHYLNFDEDFIVSNIRGKYYCSLLCKVSYNYVLWMVQSIYLLDVGNFQLCDSRLKSFFKNFNDTVFCWSIFTDLFSDVVTIAEIYDYDTQRIVTTGRKDDDLFFDLCHSFAIYVDRENLFSEGNQFYFEYNDFGQSSVRPILIFHWDGVRRFESHGQLASASLARQSGSGDEFKVLANGVVVGRVHPQDYSEMVVDLKELIPQRVPLRNGVSRISFGLNSTLVDCVGSCVQKGRYIWCQKWDSPIHPLVIEPQDDGQDFGRTDQSSQPTNWRKQGATQRTSYQMLGRRRP